MLYDYQIEAVKKMKNGCILCGDVGTGKSITSLYYYFTLNNGYFDKDKYIPMNDPPKDLYIITTAKKRDSKEWELEMAKFLIPGTYNMKVVVDSWNNIKKYQNVYSAFFIFDEQRVVGSGAWVKAFYKITNKNHWVLLSATPGDTWQDYIPVFIANHFYKNRTQFESEHCVFSRFAKYKKIDRYIGLQKLKHNRDKILVSMEAPQVNHRNIIDIYCDYNKNNYLTIVKNRWDIYENKPIRETGKLCYLMRKVVNADESRKEALIDILANHNKSIIFYNYSYELDILKEIMELMEMPYSEWNGEKHEPIPKTDKWCYLLQYTAGAEGWNCIETDTMIFYSLSYSYKLSKQAEGRIDRGSITPFRELYYYRLISRAPIDISISKALANKHNFNEKNFLRI